MANDIRWDPYLSGVPAPAEVALAALERRAPGPLPRAYLDDLQQYSGMAPEPSGVAVGRGMTTFGLLLLVEAPAERASYSIDHALEALAEWSHQAEGARGLWPFASNTASCLFCFDFHGYASAVDGPRIVLIDLAGGDLQDGMFDGREVVPVAPSYAELMASLQD